MSDIDPCDVLARHQHHRGQWGDGACTRRFGGPEHCLAYLLASAVVEAEAKVADAWDEGWEAAGDAVFYADVFLAPASEVNPYRAALDGSGPGR